MIVTFDLFSALTDSRRGGAATFAAMAAERRWPVSGAELYDEWDRCNKEAQRLAGPPRRTTFRRLSRDALAAAHTALGLDGPGSDPDRDIDRVRAGVPDWPLWPDVADGLRAVAAHARVGLLSNVDDDLVVTTRAHPLVEDDLVLTSQRLGAYKPDPAIYHRARELVGGELVHVASSARDVRGAIEAGIATVRLVRPGHRLDPEGPVPTASVTEVAGVVAALPGGPR